MTLDNNKIIKICETACEELGTLLIEVVLGSNKAGKIIEVYIDGEESITVADCSSLSRAINERLEVAEPFAEYHLDVSSPGTSRPFKFAKQLIKHIGRTFDVKYRISETEVTKISLPLAAVEGNILTFGSEDNQVKIEFEKVINTKVKISFS